MLWCGGVAEAGTVEAVKEVVLLWGGLETVCMMEVIRTCMVCA